MKVKRKTHDLDEKIKPKQAETCRYFGLCVFLIIILNEIFIEDHSNSVAQFTFYFRPGFPLVNKKSQSLPE